MRKALRLANQDPNGNHTPSTSAKSKRSFNSFWVLAAMLVISLIVHLFSGIKLSQYERPVPIARSKNPPVKIRITETPKKPKKEEKSQQEDRLPKILETPQQKTERPKQASHAGTTDHKAEKETRLVNKPSPERAKDPGQKGNPNATKSPGQSNQTAKPANPITNPSISPKNAVTQIQPRPVEKGAKIKNQDGHVTFKADQPKPRNQYEALLPSGLNDLPGQLNAGYREHIDETIEIGDRIDINTTEYRYIGYFTNMRKAIELVWNYPGEAARRGMQGEVVLEFVINKDGRASRVRVLKSSGYEILDKAIIEAINLASPFSPLPEGFHKERLLVTGSFRYVLSAFSSH